MGRVVLFTRVYATLDSFTKELGKEFTQVGHEVLYYNVQNPVDSLQQFARFAEKNIDFAFFSEY